MRVAVLGAGGFLGGLIAAGLPARLRAAEVRPLSRAEVTIEPDGAALARVLEAHAIEVVVNAAGYTLSSGLSAVDLISRSLGLARGVAAAARAVGAHVVHISSADVFPITARDGALEDAPVVPDTEYGLAKLMSELAFDDRCAVLRPSYVYGPGMPAGRLFTALIKDLSAGSAPKLRGDPERPVDWLWSGDLVDAVAIAAGRALSGVHHVVGELQTVRAAAETIRDAVAPGAALVWSDPIAGPRQTGQLSRAKFDAAKLKRTSLAEGVAQWMKP